MTSTSFGLTAIGNALVDVLAQVDDAFIAREDSEHGMKRGSMNLIGAPRAKELYGVMPPALEMSGGSAGNTMACYASFGGKGAYIGKVGQDQLGAVFGHDLKTMGVHYNTAPQQTGVPTGHCLILVTPDGQRTMNTFLGAAVELTPDDIDENVIAQSAVTYLEGYLFDPPQAKSAFYKAAEIAHKAGRKVSLTLSDSFCVDRHRKDFIDLVNNHVDILFANESEIMSLYEVFDWNDVPAVIEGKCEIVCLTRSEKGSVVFHDGDIYDIPAEPLTKMVDTTGAGDAYAAGFLYGYTHGEDMMMSGRLGAIAAAEVISHMGPRPQMPLNSLIPRRAA